MNKLITRIKQDASGRYIANEYVCVDCDKAGIEHVVQKNIPGPPTNKNSHWGPGFATILHKCTGCGKTNGPWVSSDDVGGGW